MASRTLEDLLYELHEGLATDFLSRLKSGEMTSAELNVARQFLKDNNIDLQSALNSQGAVEEIAQILPFENDDEAVAQ